MRRVYLTLWVIALTITILPAQKVGLVLSGGGAKGMTHIGIIHALEDNNIPIDYITGTSIGAIIGGLYAMGYTPQEMLTLISSKEFRECYSGIVDENNIYYIKRNEPTPEIYSVKAAIDDSITMVKALPLSIIDPIHMNIKIMELCAQATAASNGDFNKLFVPFRCVASDVYNKKELVFSNGDLGNAVRASMTFPFVFKPIKINGVLAYDGGIYNNFPANVMKRDFNPDFIIGSVVAGNAEQPSENDIISQVESMIMQASNYSLPDSSGILMDFDLTGEVGLLDFDKAQYLHDLGYATTMQLMDSIKKCIPRRVSTDSLRVKRESYRDKLPHLVFKNVVINGVKEKQRRHIINEIRHEGHKYISFNSFKRAYFRLMSENAISEIRPTAIYNPKDKTFDLILDVDIHDNLSLGIGAALSTSNVNQIYYGIDYNHMGRYSTEALLDGQLGRMYNNVQLSGRINFPNRIPMSLRMIGAYSTINYFKQNHLFSENVTPALNKEQETFIKFKLSLPFMTLHKAEFGLGLGSIRDGYIQGSTIDLKNYAYDTNHYRLLGGSVMFKQNTLNSIHYATKGASQQILAQIFTGTNEYIPFSPESTIQKEHTSWLQFSYKDQRYFPFTEKFIVGSYFEGYYSSRNFAQNYTATMMQAGVFAPTPNYLFTYNPTFRANQYIGFGLRPIYQFNSFLQVRFEAYGFVPISPILANDANKAYYGKPFSTISHIEELSIVGKFSTVVISAYINHDSSIPRGVNLGLSLGWYLFNNRFIEQ